MGKGLRVEKKWQHKGHWTGGPIHSAPEMFFTEQNKDYCATDWLTNETALQLPITQMISSILTKPPSVPQAFLEQSDKQNTKPAQGLNKRSDLFRQSLNQHPLITQHNRSQQFIILAHIPWITFTQWSYLYPGRTLLDIQLPCFIIIVLLLITSQMVISLQKSHSYT